MRLWKLVGSVFLFLSIAVAQRQTTLPEAGVIPNEQIAISVAEVIFRPVFGEEQVRKFQPYHAELKDGVWTIYGTLKQGSRGGTPQLRINKKDGRVLEIWHSQ